MLKTVLFDLDGTLLPMDQNVFVGDYFGLLARRFAPLGYEPQEFIKNVWGGVAAMVRNNGPRSNEEAFWEFFGNAYGSEKVARDLEIFEDFYRTEFATAKRSCGFNPLAAETVHKLQAAGLEVALATNPIFPDIATRQRIDWAGLTPDEFMLYTTYENCTASKPNPAYYRDLLARLGRAPEECLMVGNDVAEDMVAATLGMQVFLLTDCMINSANADISVFPHGDFNALQEYLAGQLA